MSDDYPYDFPDNFMAIFGLKRVPTNERSLSMNKVNGRADSDNIVSAFEDLIEQNGKTTTLDVKKALRDADYEVYQSEVSQCLRSYIENDTTDYDFDIIGNHRVYVKRGTVTVSTPAMKGHKKRVQKIADWTVTDGSDIETYCNMTLNQARYMFSQQYGTPYVNVTGKLDK